MKTVVILEYDFSTESERDEVVLAIRREVPARSLCSIRLAADDLAERVIETFAVEGQAKKP